MILADKIMELRKKSGWSQEELAEKLDVSRQAVSKWESAQSVPDMNRILLLSEVFGVSTDYLLKDDLDADPGKGDALPEESGDALRRVSMEEAQDFLRYRDALSRRVPLGVLLCILSPVTLILLGAAQEAGRLALTEQQAAGLGLLALFLLVGGAVALFVASGLSGRRFEYLSRESIETEYGVAGFVRERRDREQGAFVTQLVCGVVLCVLSAVPVFIAMLFPGVEGTPESDLRYAVAASALLVIVASGVWLIVRAAIRRGSCAILLEEGDYSKSKKRDQRGSETVSGIYWGLVTAGYLAYSFIAGDWQRSWIVWPVAGVLYGAVLAVCSALRRNTGK